jgi:transposase-like protein
MAGKRYSTAQRQELLALLEQRSGSLASFARRHGVSVATLYKWQEHRERITGSFVEIERRESRAPGVPALQLCVGEAQLSFERLPDAEWLARLLQKLQGCSA